MGRNRTPTSVLDARGGFITHKDRQRPNEPKADRPISPSPKYLTKDEKRVWREMAAQCCPGVLMGSDCLMFAVMVRLATKFQLGQEMKASETAQLITLSSKFAMNPADRSKVNVDKPPTSQLSMFLADHGTTETITVN